MNYFVVLTFQLLLGSPPPSLPVNELVKGTLILSTIVMKDCPAIHMFNLHNHDISIEQFDSLSSAFFQETPGASQDAGTSTLLAGDAWHSPSRLCKSHLCESPPSPPSSV